jgi:diguanylate cyclase (GGDEF)-like protein/PAS domain S-box-containing protein
MVPARHVLILNSFHQGLTWSDEITYSLVRQLNTSPLAITYTIEYLDTKRFDQTAMFELMQSTLAIKSNKQPDIILAIDKPAISFVLSHRQTLFKDIPAIFAGVSQLADDAAQDELMLNISADANPEANYQLIQTLQPDVKNILLLSDASEQGLIEQRRFRSALQSLSADIHVESFSQWTLPELKQKLGMLSANSAIIRLPMNKDANGNTLTLKESMNFIRDNSGVPVYSPWESVIKEGAIAGYVATSEQQGKVAYQSIESIFEGKGDTLFSAKRLIPTELVINEESFAKYTLKTESLPEIGKVLYPQSKGYSAQFVSTLAAVILFILLLLCAELGRRYLRSQKTLNEVQQSNKLLRLLMDANPDHIYAKDKDGIYMECNAAFSTFFNSPRDEIVGHDIESLKNILSESAVALTREHDQQVMSKNALVSRDVWITSSEGSELLVESIKTPLKNDRQEVVGLLAINRDITRRYYETAVLRQNARVLDMIIRSVPLNSILTEIVRGVEEVDTDCKCSVLLVNRDQKTLSYGVAPSLPTAYVEATDNLKIGEGVGSCGTAAATGKLVIVEDIATHPYWANYTELAAAFSLGSCWSQPILGSDHNVIGTFAIYHHESYRPTGDHITMMEQASRLVSLAIERKQVEGDLQKLSRAVEQSPTMVLITDATGAIEYVNEEFTEVTGYALGEVRGLTPSILNGGVADGDFYKDMWRAIMAGNDWHGEVVNRTKSGQQYWSMLSISPIVDEAGVITHFIGVSEDISSQKKTQEQIQQLAFYDPLTRLGNRRLFREQLEVEVKKAKRNSTIFALFYLDLDNFKQVNDTLGHDIGDRLLQTIADRLRQTLRGSDLIARIGGDEFIALLPDISGPKEAALVAEKLLREVRKPISVGGAELEATFSLGVTMAPADGEDWPVLMKNADLAMYRAKRNGRNNYQFFTREMNEEVQQRANMEQQLRSALENEEFCLHYQPQWNILSEMTPVCLEALVRWNHPQRGRVSPGEFIPIAEELGLIVELGDWVLNEACRQGKRLIDAGYHNIRIAVNLSMRQFFDPDLLVKISSALEKQQFPASLLELEITESMLMEDINVVLDTLHALKELGVSMSIDDFGTGYSSLSYLKRLPFDHLKVDASFVKDIPHDKNDMEITAAVIAMAHKLGLKVIAEGIETQEQLAFLRENGCEMGQGYLLARPAPIEDIMDIVDVEFEY